jgi:DNA-binding NtrC family response regulator
MNVLDILKTLFEFAKVLSPFGQKIELPPIVFEPIHVLIVDDDDNIRELFGRVAHTVNLETLSAATIKEAIALIERDKPDILILDWRVNGDKKDGADVLDKWFTTVNGPVAVVSGVAPLAKLRELYVYGIFHAFQKPVEVEVLTAVLNRYADIIEKDRLLEQKELREAALQEALVQMSTELRVVKTLLLLLLAVAAAIFYNTGMV